MDDKTATKEHVAHFDSFGTGKTTAPNQGCHGVELVLREHAGRRRGGVRIVRDLDADSDRECNEHGDNDQADARNKYVSDADTVRHFRGYSVWEWLADPNKSH